MACLQLLQFLVLQTDLRGDALAPLACLGLLCRQGVLLLVPCPALAQDPVEFPGDGLQPLPGGFRLAGDHLGLALLLGQFPPPRIQQMAAFGVLAIERQ